MNREDMEELGEFLKVTHDKLVDDVVKSWKEGDPQEVKALMLGRLSQYLMSTAQDFCAPQLQNVVKDAETVLACRVANSKIKQGIEKKLDSLGRSAKAVLTDAVSPAVLGNPKRWQN